MRGKHQHQRGPRIGLIGDVHQEDVALELAIRHLHAEGADLLLCTGDVVDGGGDADRCVRLLQEHSVVCVRGNHGRWMLDGLMRTVPNALLREAASKQVVSYVDSLPTSVEHATTTGLLLLCHGLGSNDLAEVRPDDLPVQLLGNRDLQRLLDASRYRFIVNGHTHERMVRQLGSTTLINAGTLDPRHRPCCALLDTSAEVVRFFDMEGGVVVPAEKHSTSFRRDAVMPHRVREIVRDLRLELPEF